LIEHDTDYKVLYLEDVFNKFVCSKNVPFISFKKYIKVYNDFTPPEYWNTILDTVILIKIPIRNYDITMEQEKLDNCFADIFIYIKDDILKIGVKTVIERKDILRNVDDIINLIYEAGLQFKVTNYKESYITGTYFVPNQLLDKYVFADMLINNNVFSTFLGINESNKTSKKKNAVFVYGTIPDTNEEITLTVTSKIVEKNDQDIKNERRDLFQIGSNYIKIKVIKGKSVASVNKFIVLLSKLITLYNQEKADVVKFYRKFIPDFSNEDKVIVKVSTKKTLKSIVPDLFVSGYTRTCSNPPEIANDNNYEQYNEEENMFLDENGNQVLLFPKSPEEGQQYYYICKDEEDKFIYPGVRLNTLSNKDAYQYVPCCYRVDQTLKNISDYKSYYHGKISETEDMQQRIITTNKFVKFNKFGYLPDNLRKMFEAIDPEHEYLRKGVSRSVNSMIECVLEGIEDILEITRDNRLAYLEEKRKEYSKSAGYATENIPDMSINVIKEDILSNSYFNPRKYTELLERLYNVKIYTFTRDMDNDKSYPLIPNYQSFITNLNKDDIVILLYEHMGNESDRAEYPQCELLIRWNRENKEDLEYHYIKNDIISNLMKNIFKKSIDFQRMNGLYPKVIKLPTFVIKNHTVDSYGKTRVIETVFNDEPITIFTNVQVPFKKAPKKIEINVIDNDVAMEFFNKHKIIPTGFYTYGDNNELIGKYGGVDYSIPVNNSDNTFGLPLTDISFFNRKDEDNIMYAYNTNKRIARYLLECLIHTFSKYVNDNDLELNTNTLKRFSETIIKTDDELSLDDFSVDFSSVKIIKDDIISIPEECINALLYRTLIILKRIPEYILEHYKKTYLDYFQDIDDFNVKKNTIIIPYVTNLNIFTKQNNLQIYKGLQLENKHHYISKLGERTFMICPTTSMNNAMYLSYFYSENKHLPTSIDSSYSIPANYTLYLFSTVNKYKTMIYGGFRPDEINIGVYKRNNVINYFAMIPLN
jgi:hypothetical protein